MSVPDEALRKVLQDLNDRVVTSSRAIGSTRQLISSRERERRLVDLTKRELKDVDESKGAKVYKGVGKMFVMESLKSTLSTLDAKDREAADDLSALNKKLKYFENEAQQATAGLKEIFEHQRRQ